MKKLFIFFFLVAVILGGFYLYYTAGILPVNKASKETQIFVIKKGDSLNLIANNLAKDGLIRNKIIFYIVVKQLGIERAIQAGDFRLSPSMDVYQIAKNLTRGTLDIWITIIEGMRKEEVAQIISQNIGIPEVEFNKVAEEGYLFPDTYLIPKEATAEAIIKILKNNLFTRFDEELQKRGEENGLNEKEILVLASLVEREAKFDNDRQQVANILLKRYRNDWPLEVDATLQYMLGYQSQEKSWWKSSIYEEDKKIDSPYNSYMNKGLPPTPISNPGLASIRAVAFANDSTPYWFYVSDSQGKLHFAQTLEEHNENIKRYVSD